MASLLVGVQDECNSSDLVKYPGDKPTGCADELHHPLAMLMPHGPMPYAASMLNAASTETEASNAASIEALSTAPLLSQQVHHVYSCPHSHVRESSTHWQAVMFVS